MLISVSEPHNDPDFNIVTLDEYWHFLLCYRPCHLAHLPSQSSLHLLLRDTRNVWKREIHNGNYCENSDVMDTTSKVQEKEELPFKPNKNLN